MSKATSPLNSRQCKELEQIVVSCNGLLQRLETSLLRERQFASDAAHELRTPISALKVQVYNLAQAVNADDSPTEELRRTAERLVDLHQGSITITRSGFETGSAFRVELPLHRTGHPASPDRTIEVASGSA